MLRCNNGIGGFRKNLVTFYGLKRCASKDAVPRFNKKSGSWLLLYETQSGGKTAQIRPSPNQNWSESQCSCIFQEPMNRGKYAYMSLWVRYALRKRSCVSKIPPVRQKNREYPFLWPYPLGQLTTLPLKTFRLRLHCYTLTYVYNISVLIFHSSCNHMIQV